MVYIMCLAIVAFAYLVSLITEARTDEVKRWFTNHLPGGRAMAAIGGG